LKKAQEQEKIVRLDLLCDAPLSLENPSQRTLRQNSKVPVVFY